MAKKANYAPRVWLGPPVLALPAGLRPSGLGYDYPQNLPMPNFSEQAAPIAPAALINMDDVLLALAQIPDPETGKSLVALPLIDDIAIEGHSIWIVLLTNQRESVMTDIRRFSIERALYALKGVLSVEVMLSYAPEWKPDPTA